MTFLAATAHVPECTAVLFPQHRFAAWKAACSTLFSTAQWLRVAHTVGGTAAGSPYQ